MRSLRPFIYVMGCAVGLSVLAGEKGNQTEAPKMESNQAKYVLSSDAKRPGAIVPEARALDFQLDFSAGKVTGAFTPTQKQIDDFENGLIVYVEKKKPSNGEHLAQRLKQERNHYRAQYVGFVVGTKKILYANFFFADSDKQFKDWLGAPVLVDDGGDHFFQVQYDVDKREYLAISVNGVA